MLGAYLFQGKGFSPNSTFDVQIGKILVQTPKPVDETLVVDVVSLPTRAMYKRRNPAFERGFIFPLCSKS
jgi:hypothetical protein